MQTVCVILIPQPGIEPMPPALEAESLDHWTKREVLNYCFLTVFPLILNSLAPLKITDY